MNKLTVRQSEVLGSIVNYQRRFGFPPTICELAGLIGCSSPNAAAEHVKAIAKKGYISVAPGVARGISLIEQNPKRISLTLNEMIRVKLSPLALNELKRLHDELKVHKPWLYGEFVAPITDEEGFTTMPLWKVMSDLGGICYNGADIPFEIEIDLEAK
ncbi:SOS-response repressor and protease LexA [Citrobacter freundii]|uniref:LexA family protein n=1 Tax=Citrobacter freundii TaxID=546 RepID=UPI0023AFD9DE|nr:SOS-response repressor and protease LexA [Citrobacter freundii]EJD6645724.1 SOS-response repressor and protease LexA [Citrobacter freundii]